MVREQRVPADVEELAGGGVRAALRGRVFWEDRGVEAEQAVEPLFDLVAGTVPDGGVELDFAEDAGFVGSFVGGLFGGGGGGGGGVGLGK